jgi:DNA-binding CsgD family transcriptional regulator
MSKSRGDDDLIAAIYDAAIDFDQWPLVLEWLAGMLGASAGCLVRQNLITAKGKMIAVRVDPKFGQLYDDYYCTRNVLPSRAGRPPVGTCLTDRMLVRAEDFIRTEFYNDYMKPWNFHSVLKAHVFKKGDYEIYVSFGCSPTFGEWEPSHINLLRRFVPYLQRAVAVDAILSNASAIRDSLGAAVAAAGFAVFLLTGDCQVLFANAKAEDLVWRKVGLLYERGRLAAASPALTARLHALAREAARPGRGEGDIGGTLELARGENRPPLLAHVIPLAPNRTVAIFDLDRPAAAIFIVDPAAGLGAQIQHFAAKFGLTAAETRVFAEIIAGNGLLAAAARLKITEATVHTHAKRIFSKTETNRQTELIRRFFETALPGSPASV